jgi:hypothetical protein
LGALTACAAAVFFLRGTRKEKLATPAIDGFQDENNINPLYEGGASMANNPLYKSAIEEQFDLDSTQ